MVAHPVKRPYPPGAFRIIYLILILCVIQQPERNVCITLLSIDIIKLRFIVKCVMFCQKIIPTSLAEVGICGGVVELRDFLTSQSYHDKMDDTTSYPTSSTGVCFISVSDFVPCL